VFRCYAVLMASLGIGYGDFFRALDPALEEADPSPYLGIWKTPPAADDQKEETFELKITEKGLFLNKTDIRENINNIPSGLFQVPDSDWLVLASAEISERLKRADPKRYGSESKHVYQLFLIRPNGPDRIKWRPITGFGRSYIEKHPGSGKNATLPGSYIVELPDGNSGRMSYDQVLSSFFSLTPKILSAIHQDVLKNPERTFEREKAEPKNEISKREKALSRLYQTSIRKLDFRDAHLSDVRDELVRLSHEQIKSGTSLIFIGLEESTPSAAKVKTEGAGKRNHPSETFKLESRSMHPPGGETDPFGFDPAGSETDDTKTPLPRISLEMKHLTLLEIYNQISKEHELTWRVTNEGLVEIGKASNGKTSRTSP